MQARLLVRRLLTWGAGTDGRAVLLASVAVYLAVIAGGRFFLNFDLWPFLGVPARPRPFIDARNLTAAWECQRLGYDPLYQSPCDPLRRPLMYPRPWLLLGVLGLDQSDTFALSVVIVAGMFVSFAALAGRVPAGTGVMFALAACSPAVMFAVERANMDVALFSVVTFALLLWRRFPGSASVLSPVIVLIAATAKVYPAFALPAFIATRNRVAARTALLCLAAFAVYFIFSLRDIRHVMAIAPQGDELSYGARILPAHLYHQFGADHWAGPRIVKQLLALVPLGILVTAFAVRVHRRLAAPAEDPAVPTASLLAFHIGALIYLGTFAAANNFDYRLVFLLLTLPQLAEWVRSPSHRLSKVAAVTLVAVLALLWIGCLSHLLNLWDELASWAAAGLLAAVIAATFPTPRALRQVIVGGAVA